jgi:predicted acetyltransferase
MDLLRLHRSELVGGREQAVQGLLRSAFPECFAARDDYYAEESPTLILLLQESSALIGHLAVYERQVQIGNEALTIGMIGGVAIIPEYRRRGHARSLLREAHDHLRARMIPFSILMASEPRVYQSSGYRLMDNEMYFLDDDDIWKTFVYRGSMYAELFEKSWPNQKLDLRGRAV